MKRILTFMLMAIVVSMVSFANDFTKAADEVTQEQVTAKMVDLRGTHGGSNIAPHVEFTNRTGKYVEVDFIVYYGGKKVDRKTVKFGGKTHKEVFNSIDAMFDKRKEKKFTVSICVTHVGK